MLQIKLIALYYYVCHCYSTQLSGQVQRFSRNSFTGKITDQELLTIYLFSTAFEEKYKLRSMYKCIQNHWLDYFPNLPSYQTFVDRINRLSACFPTLIESLSSELKQQGSLLNLYLGDSMPIMTCSAKRKGKVARSLTDKGYCSTKGMHYFGVKLHLVASSRNAQLPVPEFIGLTPASKHDLTALRPILDQLYNTTIVLDKAYVDRALKERLEKQHNTQLLTPVKTIPHTPESHLLLDKAHNDLYSRAVSSIRQPIEALFSWLQEKTQLQNASKVRSENGLIVHTFGKIAAALVLWLF